MARFVFCNDLEFTLLFEQGTSSVRLNIWVCRYNLQTAMGFFNVREFTLRIELEFLELGRMGQNYGDK